MSLLNPYCTVAQLQKELKNTSLTTDLEDPINQASRWVDFWTGRDFYEHDLTGANAVELDEFSEAAYGSQLFLPFNPVITWNSIVMGGVTLTSGSDYTVDETRGVVHLLSNDVTVSGEWKPRRLDNLIVVDFKGGYSQGGDHTTVPTEIPQVITWATIHVAAAFSGHNRKEVQGLDGNAVQLVDRVVPQTVKDVLSQLWAQVKL